MSEPKPWHRLFGLSLVDFFRDMPVIVELEKDLSLKYQLLDVAIIRKDRSSLPCRLPDGFENHLVTHNLISFKSLSSEISGNEYATATTFPTVQPGGFTHAYWNGTTASIRRRNHR
jgi:hypothetical protein